jgi:hypothetical protein
MGERREVRGTNWRVRQPVRDGSESRDVNVPLESNQYYLQHLAELLFKPKREDGTP